MKKSTKLLIAAILLVFVSLLVFAFRWWEPKFPALPTYSGAQNLQEQTLNNGKTRIVTFQVNEKVTKASLAYIKNLMDVGWNNRLMASSSKTTSYTLDYTTESVDLSMFGLRLTGGTCPNFLLYMDATENEQEVTTVTVRQEMGKCSS